MINTTQNITIKHLLEHNLKANISCFQINYYNKEGIWVQERHLYWTEDNRLHTAVDNNYYSYYAYDHTGERTLKLTGKNTFMDVNGETQASASLNNVTLYVGPYLVATNQGYTKHYYNGTERICAKLGNGGLGNNLTSKNNYSTVADGLFSQCQTAMKGQSMKDEDQICITSLSGEWEQEMKLEDYKGKFTPIQPSLLSKISADVTTFGNTLASYKSSKSAKETNIYFYHSDHLGSVSWITNKSGNPVQHLQYMPYGEPLVNERKSSYEERFTFTGKERDSETGFSYFGARYYDSDLMTGWLSVDPLADDFSNISPYNYCEWNPVKLKDPDGNIPLLANIAGAAFGAAVDIAGQVVYNYFAEKPIGNINWTSVGISAVEGALTAGGSVVKQVAVTTAKNTFVKSASKATIKATAKREVFNKTVQGTASVARAYFDDGPFVENLGYEAASAVLGSTAAKVAGKIAKPKLLTNDGALQAARNKNGGHISGKEASKITEANRTNNQIKVNNNNRNIEKTSSFVATVLTSAVKGLNDR